MNSVIKWIFVSFSKRVEKNRRTVAARQLEKKRGMPITNRLLLVSFIILSTTGQDCQPEGPLVRPENEEIENFQRLTAFSGEHRTADNIDNLPEYNSGIHSAGLRFIWIRPAGSLPVEFRSLQESGLQRLHTEISEQTGSQIIDVTELYPRAAKLLQDPEISAEIIFMRTDSEAILRRSGANVLIFWHFHKMPQSYCEMRGDVGSNSESRIIELPLRMIVVSKTGSEVFEYTAQYISHGHSRRCPPSGEVMPEAIDQLGKYFLTFFQ